MLFIIKKFDCTSLLFYIFWERRTRIYNILDVTVMLNSKFDNPRIFISYIRLFSDYVKYWNFIVDLNLIGQDGVDWMSDREIRRFFVITWTARTMSINSE